MNTALIDLARDLSGNDANVISKITEITTNPPTSTEEIGFYGMKDASAAERTFRAAIFQLSKTGYIYTFEDKYLYEMPLVLADDGAIAALPGLGDFFDSMTATEFREGFPAHIDLLERAAAQKGRALLSVALPVGDSFYIVSVSPEIADKWRNVVFLQQGGDVFGMTEPEWSLYYSYLSYALRLDNVGWPSLPPRGAMRTLSDIGYSE